LRCRGSHGDTPHEVRLYSSLATARRNHERSGDLEQRCRRHLSGLLADISRCGVFRLASCVWCDTCMCLRCSLYLRRGTQITTDATSKIFTLPVACTAETSGNPLGIR
jgi:hypothetical protein